MSATETWTIGKLLNWTSDYLKKHGASSPRLDAEVLLSHACECQRIELYTAFDTEPSETTRVAFRELVRRRAEGTPVAYLVGQKEFYALPFEVNPDVLIPRPETEHLVLAALDCAKLLGDRPLRIVDVGTGSGAVAVTVAKHLPKAHVMAVDISEKALAVAARNAIRHLGEGRLELIQSDLLDAIPAEPGLDIVLSNPPYVSEAEYATLPKTVRDFEPKLALVAGPDGGEVISKLLAQALPRLVPGGFCVFEFSPMLNARLNQLVGPGWATPQVAKDLAGLPRIVTLRKVA